MAGYCSVARESMKQAASRPKPAVAEPGVRLLLDQLVDVPAFDAACPPHDRLGRQIHHVVAQCPAEQKLHRQVVDALGMPFLARPSRL